MKDLRLLRDAAFLIRQLTGPGMTHDETCPRHKNNYNQDTVKGCDCIMPMVEKWQTEATKLLGRCVKLPNVPNMGIDCIDVELTIDRTTENDR